MKDIEKKLMLKNKKAEDIGVSIIIDDQMLDLIKYE